MIVDQPMVVSVCSIWDLPTSVLWDLCESKREDNDREQLRLANAAEAERMRARTRSRARQRTRPTIHLSKTTQVEAPPRPPMRL
jgi:hypothetical protein